jgi:hypothetical protein
MGSLEHGIISEHSSSGRRHGRLGCFADADADPGGACE